MREFYLVSIIALLILAPVERNSEVNFPGHDVDGHAAAEAAEDGIDVLAYNAFMRPIPVGLGDANFCRSIRIGDILGSEDAKYDLVAFTETFDLRATQMLRHKLRESHPYQVLRKPLREGLETNGGLSLFSKFPIENWTSKRFDECSGTFNDCLAAKGFLHALVRVSDRVKFNVITTHLNSGRSEGSRHARRTQLDQLRDYIDENSDIARWPTLIMGDLNVDGLVWERSHPLAAEYDEMMSTLGNTCSSDDDSCSSFPRDVLRDYVGRWDMQEPDTRAISTYNCADHGLESCEAVTQPDHADRRQRLDYVLDLGPPALAPHRTLGLEHAAHRPMKDDSCQTTFLSDHAAIEASFDVQFGG